MKFEIDLSDRTQLIKQKAELTRYLNIVEYALTQFGNVNRNGSEPSLPNLESEHTDNEVHVRQTDQPILDMIEKFPRKVFTTSDVIVAMGDQGKESRGAVKMALKRAAEAGQIKVVSLGKGRRPTQYEKTTKLEYR